MFQADKVPKNTQTRLGLFLPAKADTLGTRVFALV